MHAVNENFELRCGHNNNNNNNAYFVACNVVNVVFIKINKTHMTTLKRDLKSLRTFIQFHRVLKLSRS